MNQTFPKDQFEWLVEVGIGQHDLNAAFNRMIKRAKGELIVFYEDYTKILPDGLERFWKAYRENPNTCFTAPLGKVDKFGDAPRWDWRANKQNTDQKDYTECNWNTCELDWGAIPKKILVKIGGFDEELDKFWSCDNVNVGCRADLAGAKFKCVFTNPAIAIDHDKIIAHPFRSRYNSQFNNKRMDDFRRGLKIDYLT
jgi:GT2 family glycosyltransferase